MDDLQLPADLEHIERLLSAPPRPDLSPGFRSRLLLDLHLELRSGTASRRWHFAMPVVVSVALSLGFLCSMPQAGIFAYQQSFSLPSVESVAAQLQDLAPGLSKADSLRLAGVRQISITGNSHALLESVVSETGKL